MSGRATERLWDRLLKSGRNTLGRRTLSVRAQRVLKTHLADLESYRFWNRRHGRSRLWPHQVEAIGLACGYIAAWHNPISSGRRLPGRSALIKMPTGTGKTGVIATLARCLTDVRRTLVLTPRIALVEQLIADAGSEFFVETLGYVASDPPQACRAPRLVRRGVRRSTAHADDIDGCILDRLLDSNRDRLAKALADSRARALLVGTPNALLDVQMNAAQEPASHSRTVLEALKGFDLVVVDEGHYEPAPEWGPAVRRLGRPTLLLSATPFRNDYKAFKVAADYVFNYSYDEAVKDAIIREVLLYDSPSGAGHTGAFDGFAARVATLWQELVRDRRVPGVGGARLVVRADEFESLSALQRIIERACGTVALLVHHQQLADDSKARRFHNVAAARMAADKNDIRILLHESKLLEGIDDPAIVAIACYSPFENARQMIQQAGRAVRRRSRKTGVDAKAYLMARPELLSHMKREWKQYERWERYCRKSPAAIVSGETALPELVLEHAPEIQYIGRTFRTRFGADGPCSADELAIPATTAAYLSVKGAIELDRLATEVEEMLSAEDRFEVTAVTDGPGNCRAFTYYMFNASRLLRSTLMPEWHMGVCALVAWGDLLFAHDTEGIDEILKDAGLTRVTREKLLQAFPDRRDVRVNRMSFISLDLSDRAIRSQITRTHSFADTFTDLLDPALVPTAVSGVVGGTPRYVGLRRARVSESGRARLSLGDFADWTRGLAAQFSGPSGASPIHGVFGRYADVVTPPDAAGGMPISVLLDLSDRTDEFGVAAEGAGGDEHQDPDPLDFADLCADVDGEGQFTIVIDEDRMLSATIEYRAGRYVLKSDDLNELLPPREENGAGRTPVTFCGSLNREQAFRVITASALVYAHGYFYRPERNMKRAGIETLLSGVPAFAAATSEKGEAATNRRQWTRESVFGMVHSISSEGVTDRERKRWFGAFGHELDRCSLIVCDDDGSEMTDFVALDERGKRVIFVHAKAKPEAHPKSVTEVQVVGRQVLASLAHVASVNAGRFFQAGRLGTKWKVGRSPELPRIWRDRANRAADEAQSAIEVALRDRSWNREVWMALGRILGRQQLLEALREERPDAKSLHLAFYLAALDTACGRGNVKLRAFCADDLPAGAGD